MLYIQFVNLNILSLDVYVANLINTLFRFTNTRDHIQFNKNTNNIGTLWL